MAQYFEYNTAIVRKISKSLPENALRLEPSSTHVDLALAHEQKERYVNELRALGLKVIEIESDDDLPDCVFVEDVVVVAGNTALLTKPGHPSRRPEVNKMRDELKALNVKLSDMSEIDLEATLDGGDVLFTGKEFFVGISKRTNEAGYKVLAGVFKEFPVSSIKIREGLHLKSFCSMANEQDMLVSIEADDYILQELKKHAKFSYNYLTVKGHMCGANCLYINSPTKGKTIIYPHDDVFPQAKETYDQLNGYNKIGMNMEELSKVDGALTCCSILIKQQ